MADTHPGRAPYSGVLDDFRQVVAERLGTLAAAVLDTRLRGDDVKNLVGQPEFGTPSAYAIKQAVSEIKKLAQWFAAQSGDAAFLARVERAMSAEAGTAAKRVAWALTNVDPSSTLILDGRWKPDSLDELSCFKFS